MSLPQLFMGGCVAVGGAVFLTSKMLRYIYGPPNAASSSLAAQGGNESEAERARRLEKQLEQLKASLATLNSQYMEKYGVKPAERTAPARSSSKRRASKSSKSSCPTSDSSTEAPMTQTNKKSCSRTFTVGSSAAYTDAKSAGSVEDPLVGKPEVEANEKVEKWLESNTVDAVKPSRPTYPKAVAMTISLRDNAVDRDPFDACETYVVSAPRRESPKKTAPHLYKRLSLRKKSAVTLSDAKPARSRSRKSEEEGRRVASGPREDADVEVASSVELRASEGVDSNDECAANTEYNAICAGTFGSWSETPRAEGNQATAEPSEPSEPYEPYESLEPSEPSARKGPSQTRLKKKIDQVLETNPTSFETRRSAPTLESRRSGDVKGLAGRKPAPRSDEETKSASARAGSSKTNLPGKTPDSREPGPCEDVPSRDRVASSACSPSRSDSMDMREEVRVERPKTAGHVAVFPGRLLQFRSKEQTKSAERVDLERKERTKSADKLALEHKERTRSAVKLTFERKEGRKYYLKPVSESQERTKSADKLALERQERTKSTDKLGLAARTNSFEKRKSQTKETSGRDGARSDERDSKANQFVKRKEFVAKFHMKDGRDALEEVAKPSRKSPFDKRKQFQAKYQMREHAESDNPKVEQQGSRANQFVKRKEFVAKFHMKDGREAVEEAAPPARKTPFDKRKQFQAKYHMRSSSPVQASKSTDSVDARARAERRKEALSLFEKKYLPGRTEPKSPEDPSTDEAGRGKGSPLQRRLEYDARCRMKASSSSQRKTATPEGPPSMNRQPNDGARKAYVFDWNTKLYDVADKPDVLTGSPPPPVKGKSLPAPRGMKRPLSAGVTPRRPRAWASDAEEGVSSEGELSASSVDFEFDPRGLSESSLSSELSEETMVTELKNKASARRCPGFDSDGDEGGRKDTTSLPGSPSECSRKESTSQPSLPDLVDWSATNGNLASRSAEAAGSDEEEDPCSHVFTGNRALRKAKKSLFTKGSATELAILTKGFRRTAMDET